MFPPEGAVYAPDEVRVWDPADAHASTLPLIVDRDDLSIRFVVRIYDSEIWTLPVSGMILASRDAEVRRWPIGFQVIAATGAIHTRHQSTLLR